jgi:hypothetical protein
MNALGDSLKSLNSNPADYFEELLEEAKTVIKKLEERNTIWQQAYEELRWALVQRSYSYILETAGAKPEYRFTSTYPTLEIKTFDALTEGVEWAEGRVHSKLLEKEL